MPQTQSETPKTTLAEALALATGTDDLDTACATLQDVLGVTDGGLAGVAFSDLDDKAGPGRMTWADLPAPVRHERLVAYIKSEVDLMARPADEPLLDIPGFDPWMTGGGCMALGRELPDGSRWLVTADDGVSIPRRGDRIFVSHESPDRSDTYFDAEYAFEDFDLGLFLERVAESAGTDPAATAGDDDFEAFRATRRSMSSREYGALIGDAMWEDDPDLVFLVYEDQWWIEARPGGAYSLVIENRTWMSDDTTRLEDLERELHRFTRMS